MKIRTPMRRTPQVRPSALALGAFFAGVTGYVLFADVIGGAPVTTGHVLSLAALVAAISSGHSAWPQIRDGAIFPGIMLGLLFLGSTGYIVVASGARNAETAAAKTEAAKDLTRARADALRMKADAEFILGACPANTPKTDFGIRCGLRDAATAECASGRGKRCDGKSYSVSTYESAIKGYEQTLKELGPEKPSSGYRHAARVLAALPGVTSEASAIEAKLELLIPFATVLISELGTIVFLHIGLGHRAPAHIPANDALPGIPKSRIPVKPTPPKGGKRGRKADPRVIDFTERFSRKHGRAPTGGEIRSAFPGMAQSTAYDYAARASRIAA
jgi:hypothetical protein